MPADDDVLRRLAEQAEPVWPLRPRTVSLRVDGSPSPGQEVCLVWSVSGLMPHRTLSATIFGPAEQLTREVALDEHGDTGEQRTILLPPQDADLARLLYRQGPKKVTLWLFVGNTSVGTHEVEFEMPGEDVKPAWWEWRTSALLPRNVAYATWKQPYALNGTLTNHAGIAMRLTALELRERDTTTGGTLLFDPMKLALPASVAAGASEPCTWPRMQEWDWLHGSGTNPLLFWKVAGPLSKEFVYTARFSIEDDYDNRYPDVDSATYTVFLSVPERKIALARTRNALRDVGLGVAVVAGAITVAHLAPVAAALAAHHVAAGGLVASTGLFSGAKYVTGTLSDWSDKLALDPPEPDPRYSERVELVVPAMPEGLEPQSLRPVLGPVGRGLAAIDALGQIEGRLLGARGANDLEAQRRQAAAYREMLGELVRAVSDAQAMVSEMTPTYNRDTRFSPATQRALAGALLRAWRDARPPELAIAWQESGLPDLSFLPEEDIPEVVARLDGLGTQLERATDGLRTVARAAIAELPDEARVVSG